MRFQLNAPNVVQEAIDGEVMVVHLVTGVYYNLSGISAHLWSCVINGVSLAELCEHYIHHFPELEQSITSALDTFQEALKSEELIKERQDEPNELEVAESLSAQLPVSWQTPELCRHTDMQELLLVDPIHEVEPTGWPQKKPR